MLQTGPNLFNTTHRAKPRRSDPSQFSPCVLSPCVEHKRVSETSPTHHLDPGATDPAVWDANCSFPTWHRRTRLGTHGSLFKYSLDPLLAELRGLHLPSSDHKSDARGVTTRLVAVDRHHRSPSLVPNRSKFVKYDPPRKAPQVRPIAVLALRPLTVRGAKSGVRDVPDAPP